MQVCNLWSNAGVLWSNANWIWSQCSGSIPPTPPVVVIGNQPGVDAETLIQPWQIEEPWNPYRTSSLDKRKRLIKLMCKVNGKEYNEEREAKDFPVKVGDIRATINTDFKIDIDFKLEE